VDQLITSEELVDACLITASNLAAMVLVLPISAGCLLTQLACDLTCILPEDM